MRILRNHELHRTALLTAALCLIAPVAVAQDAPPAVGVTWVSPLHVFSVDDIQGGFDGSTCGEDPSIICGLWDTCPLDSEQPWVDKDGDLLFPIDSEFGFVVTDFVGGEQRIRDYVHQEGWAGNLWTDDSQSEYYGLKVSTIDTDFFKGGSPRGTWCAGLGGISVKCSTEHMTVMEHVLTCDQSVPYLYYPDPDGDPAPDPDWPCGELDIIPNEILEELEPNESSVIDDIAVGDDYSVTKKDDGKILYRWGTAVKRPIDVRLYSSLELPPDWKTSRLNHRVLRAHLIVRHTITNNPNDQLRPEDWENEGARGLKPRMLVDDIDGSWTSMVDCYEGDSDYIPAGTVLRDPTCGGTGCFPDSLSEDLVEGLSNAWYTTIDRDPFYWSYLSPTGELVGSPVADNSLGELVSGPRWRLIGPKFGQDIPGLEIPAVACEPPPYEHGTTRYVRGEPATTVINLLDWVPEEILDADGNPIPDPDTGEPMMSRSPLLYSFDWINSIDPNTGESRCIDDIVDECVSINGLPLTDDFDLAVYVKGDKKPVSLYDAQVVIEYAVQDPTDLGDAPETGPLPDDPDYYPSGYPTTTAVGGARHHVLTDPDGGTVGMPTLTLGSVIDAEFDGQPDADALGDDELGFDDDEDGVTFNTGLAAGLTAEISVEALYSLGFVGDGFLNAWVDFDRNGSWDDEGEQIATDLVLLPGDNELQFLVPATAEEGVTFARFRLSSLPSLSAFGDAPDGEVEDYMVEIVPGLGFDDLVARNATGDLLVAISSGLTFKTSTAGDGFPKDIYSEMRVGDFDGDGRDDVAGRSLSNGQWYVALADESIGGIIHFDNPSPWGGGWSTDYDWVDVLVGDFNGDGLADLAGRRLTYPDSQQWRVSFSTGSTLVDEVVGTWSADYTWVDVMVGDFNEDGDDEIAGRHLEDGAWYVNLIDGHDEVRYGDNGWPQSVDWADVVAGDFNGDGMDDVAGRNAATGNWFVSLCERFGPDDDNFRFIAQENWGAWRKSETWTAVATADVNGDGADDIVGLSESRLYWLVNVSLGNDFDPTRFAGWSRYGAIHNVVIGDFNGDGMDDVAGREPTRGRWVVGISDGLGFVSGVWGRWPLGDYYDAHTGNFD